MYNMIFTPQIEILSNFENMFPYTVYLPVSICMLCTLFDAYCGMCRMTWWMIAEPASLSNVHSTGCMQQHSVWHLMLKCFSRLSCKTSALCHMWPINMCLFPLPLPSPPPPPHPNPIYHLSKSYETHVPINVTCCHPGYYYSEANHTGGACVFISNYSYLLRPDQDNRYFYLEVPCSVYN